jgi:predicted TIM-barrel fold metal-dependent hydrolase
MKNRREFLKTLAAMMPAGGLMSQNNRAARAATGRIDVHHHRIAGGGGARGGAWSPSIAIEQMDKYGITTSITSVSAAAPSLYDGTAKSRAFARETNEYGAKMVQNYPGRFGLFAALPMPDTDGSLKEIEHAYDALKADGVHIYSSIGDKWPGDAAYAPIYTELNRRKAIVFVHPTPPGCCTLPPGIGAAVTEYDFDMTRAATSLLWNGVFSKFPEIRFIVVHSGGTLPVLAGRIQDRVPRDRPDLYPTGALDQLKKLYYEVAHATFPWAIAALMKFTSTSQILFGTDYPQEPIESTTKQIPGLGLSAEILHAIDRGNAERLFPRFKA